MLDYKPGQYETVRNATIRKTEPAIKDNYYGQYPPGRQVTVYDIAKPNPGWVWGRISEFDDVDHVALWMCIESPNKTYLKQLAVSAPVEINYEAEFANLKTWAMIQGYDPNKKYKK